MKRGKSKNSFKNSKQIKTIFGVLALVVVSAVFVYASGLILNGKAFVVSKSASAEVPAYGDCIKVTNNLAWDLFIPLNTPTEWSSFKNAILPSGLTKGACSPSEVFGCTDPAAKNYDPLATIDNGECYYCNLNSDCGTSSCDYVREGYKCLYKCDLYTCDEGICNSQQTQQELNPNVCSSNECVTNQDCEEPQCSIVGCKETCYPQVCNWWGECVNGPAQIAYIC